jgi:hypothetical protein
MDVDLEIGIDPYLPAEQESASFIGKGKRLWRDVN